MTGLTDLRIGSHMARTKIEFCVRPISIADARTQV